MVKIGLIFVVCSSCPFAQPPPYNQANITELYQTWQNVCTGITTTNDVVHLNGGESWTLGYCDQAITTVHVLVKPDGTFLIFGTGDDKFVGTDNEGGRRGDAIYLIQRLPSGQYRLFPAGCTQYATPILAFAEDTAKDWGKVGWLGQGMWVFYSDVPDYCGHQYFGIVPVFDKGDRVKEDWPIPYKDDDRAFLAWAFSMDGYTWHFMEDFSLTPKLCSSGAWWTDDPKEAHPLLYRDGFQMDYYAGQWGREVFHHLGVFYSDPARTDVHGNAGDGHVYVFLGYTATTPAVWNLLARVEFVPNNLTGKGAVELFKNDPDGLYCPDQGSWEFLTECTVHTDCHNSSVNFGNTFSDACIPCNLTTPSQNKNQYIGDLAVPYELYPVYKGSQLQFLMMLYNAGWSFETGRTVMRVSTSIVPPFHFTEEKTLGNCPLTASGYTPCGGGGEGLGIVQPPCTDQWKALGYYDASCNPLAVIGFVNATTKVCTYTVGGQTYYKPIYLNSEGILPVKISLSNTNWSYDIQDLRASKTAGGGLRLSWGTIMAPYVNSLRVLRGSFSDGFIKPGTQCAPYEQVVYDHYRLLDSVQGNSVDLVMPTGDAYFLVAPTCNEILMPDKQGDDFWCFVQTGTGWPIPVSTFIGNYLSEGSMGYSSVLERLNPVCQCTEGGPTCGAYWPQPGDSWR
jgi:hypothetical protein